MKPRTKRILIVLSVVLLLILCGLSWLAYVVFSPNSAQNQASAMECTLSWGRLAPFPGSAQVFAIVVEGSMFTRAFRASFIAPAAEIEQWLQQSPGTQSVSPSRPSPGKRHFEIEPGGGAQHAEVNVDDARHLVSIYVYWS